MQKQNWETRRPPQLYTSEQKKRRDESIWTLIQGVLAPTQFIAFAISTVLVIWYLWTGDGYGLATISVLVKTALLLTIMVTGAIWEKVVFGQYLLAPAFFWEDIVSFFVIFLHLAICCFALGKLSYRTIAYDTSVGCLLCLHCECWSISFEVQGRKNSIKSGG